MNSAFRLALLSGLAFCLAMARVGRADDAPLTSPNLRYYYPITPGEHPQTIDCDVCVYGGTSGGVTAAIQAARMGKKTVLLEFGTHIGGLTTGGLSATDGGSAAGGIAREFYNTVGQSGFKPAVAEQAFRDMLKTAGVGVYTEHRLIAVKKDGNRLTEVRCDNGDVFRGKMFVDTTYEGDLMAAAGVTYHVGREANSAYGETLDGVQKPGAHNFDKPVDPYVIPGDPRSGVLWGIQGQGLAPVGTGDNLVQAYNFRMYLEKDGLPFPKPREYDPKKYELLLRYIQAGGGPGVYPHKGDNNNQGGFSTDNIGRSYDWPDGTARGDLAVKKDEAYFKALYALREKIYQDHVDYQQGLVYFVAHDPRVPQAIRDKLAPWGLTKDSFKETGGFPHALYVREGRRMISDYVMTEHNCRHQTKADDSVGLAQYNMDSHNCQRVVLKDPKTGNVIVKNEGDVQVGVPGPYPVAYRAMVPKEAECANLLVPVCLSSTHIAFGSIRMEPVFMVLSQSAATAGCLALDAGVPVQKVDYAKLRERLLADKQMLDWTGKLRTTRPSARGSGVDPSKLPGIALDDAQAELTGEWLTGSGAGRIGPGYHHDGNTDKGKCSAKFTAPIKEAGAYEVRFAYTPNGNRATNVPVTVSGATEDKKTTKVNEKIEPPVEGRWVSLGVFHFAAGSTATVAISNAGTDGFVVIDGVQLVPSPAGK